MGKGILGSIVLLLAASVAGCSSSDSGSNTPSAQSCSVDGDCPSGQGCKTETNDGYCAPLCMTAATCPVQSQCKASTDAPKQECKEVGSHKGGSGVCDLYNGSFGPKTCN